MILTLSDVLTSDDISDVHGMLKTLAWRDGVETAGSAARVVKRNEQADLTTRMGVRLREFLFDRISTHPVLDASVRPGRFSSLLVSRTRDGGGYGLHVDNPFMTSGTERMRTDVSFTLFLSDPATYEGGELSIETAGLSHEVKGQAGDLVLYPSTTLHGVAPVLSGERIVCVGWIESQVRCSAQREILFDLENLRADLLKSHNPNSPEMLILSKTTANLKRMWTG